MNTTRPAITVRGTEYTIELEPGIADEIRPYLYNARGELAGMVYEPPAGRSYKATIIGAPKRWTNADCRKAAQDALAALEVTR
jgi:hypothetical protein